jgi:hypothetical protein
MPGALDEKRHVIGQLWAVDIRIFWPKPRQVTDPLTMSILANDKKSLMSRERQPELMFIDANEVILDAKTQLSQFMRWVVTLNSGIILFFSQAA